MSPTELLKREHRAILSVLEAAEKEVDQINVSGTVRADRIEAMVAFFREFADRCHNTKEEKLLYQKMKERGMPIESGPIASIIEEHRIGRSWLRGVEVALAGAIAGDQEALAAIAENLTTFVSMVKSHIDREDRVLFFMAEKILTKEDQRELSRAFRQVDEAEGRRPFSLDFPDLTWLWSAP